VDPTTVAAVAIAAEERSSWPGKWRKRDERAKGRGEGKQSESVFGVK